MGKSKKPCHMRDYTYNKEKKRFEPFFEVFVGTKELKRKVVALVDTGCSTCMHFCKSYIDKEKLTFIKKINIVPVPFGVADGHTINGDYYKAVLQIGEEEKEIIVSVIDPKKFFKEEKEAKIETVMPLLGRETLKEYDTLFKGKERITLLFHPE